MSVQFKATGQAEIANRLREFAAELDKGLAVVVDMNQSLMQEPGSNPEWLMTLRWGRPTDNGS